MNADRKNVERGRALSRENAFNIANAKYSESEGAYSILVSPKRLLSAYEMDCVQAFICDGLESNLVRIKFDFSDAIHCFRESLNDGGDCAFMLELWAQNAPELRPVIKAAELRFTDNKDGVSNFTMGVAPEFLRVLQSQYLVEFQRFVYDRWQWQVRISLFPEESQKGVPSKKLFVTRDSGRTPDTYRKDTPSTQIKKRSGASARSMNAVDPLSIVIGKEINRPKITNMVDIDEATGNVTVLGTIIDIETTETRDKLRTIIKLNLTDKTNTITVKLFPDQSIAARAVKLLDEIRKENDCLLARGNYRYDSYARDYVLFANDVNRKPSLKRMDECPEGERRVELHLHTQMSAMDGITRVADAVATAARWGHKAVAITDHGVVHALPEAMKVAKKSGIKVIFGCEGYLLDDSYLKEIEGEYAAVAATIVEGGTRSLLFEIAAIRFNAQGEEIGSYHTYVNPGVSPSAIVMEQCGFSEQCINEAPAPFDAIQAAANFVRGAMLVVGNGALINSIGALCEHIKSYDHVDVFQLDKNMHLDIKDYSMKSAGAVAEVEKPVLVSAKRIAKDTKNRLCGLIAELRDKGLDRIPIWKRGHDKKAKPALYHIILLAAEQEGLKNLYKLVSYSHLEFFNKRPRIPRSLLYLYRTGIILGSACERGELFRAITNKLSYEEQKGIASWYDYLEIQPIANNAFMLKNGMAKDENELESFNKRVLELGDDLGKPVVATGDVHFLEPEDAIYRSILMSAHGFTDAEQQAPLYFRTTDDMLKEFAYLGKERAYEVVVTNPNGIADKCKQLHPFLDEKNAYSPELPGATEELERLTMGKAYSIYGDPLPDIVQKRLDKELRSIIGNGYSSLYMVAQKLVAKSIADGYLVGSRGSVGSSFVATMLGITEVNALPPHYVCPECKYSEFIYDAKSRCGIDLPHKRCPICSASLKREGYDIPFEVFLGFKGDKTPDIDLNFSGEYQPVAHRFTEEMFGAGHAFRAGTISAVQDKTVYGYVKNYCAELDMHITDAETNRLVSGCLGVKKTTGQHPGGIVIVPEGYEIFDFCPVQHPADKADSGNITTHFDFHALDDRLVKLDILGHDDPTALKMLHDMTGVDPRSIPTDDPKTMAIYRTDEPLNISLEPLGCDVGSLGIPEFGTGFVRNILKETRPTTMEELVRIAGLSHGTDVWTNNAQQLVQSGVATLMDVICTRDDIINYLISMGGEPSLSFKTMESVRRGRGLTNEMESAMKGLGVPSWFIESCKKIQYMFPRAHAAAYVMMSFRIAYYKVHYPLEFYAVYFTVRADTFDIQLCMGGLDAVMENLNKIKKIEHPDQKEKDALTILEVVAEMNMRGFELLPVDIYKSKAKEFVIEGGKLRPPFTSVAGLGESVAIGIANASAESPYLSKEDFAKRTKANTAVMEKLSLLGCFEGMSESNQLRLF